MRGLVYEALRNRKNVSIVEDIWTDIERHLYSQRQLCLKNNIPLADAVWAFSKLYEKGLKEMTVGELYALADQRGTHLAAALQLTAILGGTLCSCSHCQDVLTHL